MQKVKTSKKLPQSPHEGYQLKKKTSVDVVAMRMTS